jgi:hypothetical protein
MAGTSSIKRTLIAKSNTTIVAVTSGACFIVVFCAVASVSLFGQLSYQNRIIGADKTALKQLKDDIQASKSLEASYKAFTSTTTNIIGGSPNGTGSQDGTNAKIVLDALPSKYDYPALATSLENILTSQTVQIQSITGTDDAANQSNNQSSTEPAPQPMPFQAIVQGNYPSIQNVVSAFERSIRPFQIQTMELSGDQSQLSLTIDAQTYYQPAKNLNIRTKVVQ